MGDIVERLKAVSGCTQKTFMHRLDWEEGRQIIAEAATEIEHLRLERRHACQEIGVAVEERDEARAEIERLRKGLEAAAAARMPGEGRRVAREALDGSAGDAR